MGWGKAGSCGSLEIEGADKAGDPHWGAGGCFPVVTSQPTCPVSISCSKMEIITLVPSVKHTVSADSPI